MDHSRRGIELDDESRSDDAASHRVVSVRVGVDFFDALEQPILTGRGFDLADLDGNRSAVVVNTGFVDRVLGGRNPIGRRFRYATPPDEEPGPWYEIVGVVGPLGMDAIDPDKPGLYHPLAPGELHPVHLAIHVGDDPGSFAPRLRELAGEVDPAAIISGPVPLDEVFSFDANVVMWIRSGALTFIGILLALSASGIYALMSFTIAERAREIGIRTALGAQRSSIVLTIARNAFAQLGVGALLGMSIAAFLLFNFKEAGRISTHSLLLLALVMGVGVAVLIGTVACIVPTLRALRIMPTEALRSGA